MEHDRFLVELEHYIMGEFDEIEDMEAFEKHLLCP